MGFTRLNFVLQFIFIICFVGTFAITATAQDYYPTVVGNTWVFLNADGTEKRTYTIEEAEGEAKGIIILRIYTETLGTDTVDDDVYYISDDNGDLLLHKTHLNEGAFGIAAAILDPPTLFFPSVLPLGRTWDVVTTTELKLVGTANTTSTITVVDIEDLETPAGTFENCVKLEINRKVATAVATLRFTSYQWLAPDVGPVKYVDDQDIVYELQSYTLLGETQVEETQVETPQVEETQVETPQVEETQVETPQVEETQVETPQVEETQVETPQVEETQVETPTDQESVMELPPDIPSIPESNFEITLAQGLNMISIPLMPSEPYSAKSLATKLGASIVIKLDATTQTFVGYSYAEEGDGFEIDGRSGYIVNTPAGGKFTFSGTAWMHESKPAAAPKIINVDNAWAFILTSNLQGLHTGETYTITAKNLRTGVIATEKVSSEKESVSAVWANLNRKSVVKVGDKLEIILLNEHGTIVSGPFERTVQTSDIHNAFMTVQLQVGDVRPKKTILAQNYPNPFNPETWIPYQLSSDSNVTIKIYDVSGQSIRTMNLGHQSLGSYMTSSTAAYWDGKNGAGEFVSSGIYFYTLQTKNFSATRRMVILK